MSFRDATRADLGRIALLADANDLLIPPLDQPAFARMLSWLHEDAPEGQRLEFVFEEDENIVAHYGAVPFQYKVNDQRVIAGFAANIVIDKNARKKALFFPLQKHFAELYPKLDYGFAYGVMTRAGVLKPHLAVGWKQVGELKVYVKPISASGIIKKMLPRSLIAKLLAVAAVPFQSTFHSLTSFSFNRVELREIVAFDASHEDFLSRWTAEQAITAVRSAQILNWRFLKFAERGYKITGAYKQGKFGGYVVTRAMPMRQFSCLAIVDLVALNGDSETISALLEKASSEAKRRNVDFISTLFPPHYAFKSLMFRKGFLPSPEKFTLVSKAPKDSTLGVQASAFTQWFINWFDHDFV